MYIPLAPPPLPQLRIWNSFSHIDTTIHHALCESVVHLRGNINLPSFPEGREGRHCQPHTHTHTHTHPHTHTWTGFWLKHGRSGGPLGRSVFPSQASKSIFAPITGRQFWSGWKCRHERTLTLLVADEINLKIRQRTNFKKLCKNRAPWSSPQRGISGPSGCGGGMCLEGRGGWPGWGI